MKILRSFVALLLVASHAAAFSAESYKNKKLDHRNHDVAKNPEPVVKHSTERLEEPGRKRNYGTEYTKPKRRHEEVDLRHREQGRVWSYGTFPYLHQKSTWRE